jgi:hypothetical protein
MADSDAPKQYPFEAAYRGLASIILGGLPLVMVLPALNLSWYWVKEQPPYAFARQGAVTERVIIVILALAIVAVVVAVAGCGILQGHRGRAAARHTGEPRVLCNTGIWFGWLAVFAWIGTGYFLTLRVDSLFLR